MNRTRALPIAVGLSCVAASIVWFSWPRPALDQSAAAFAAPSFTVPVAPQASETFELPAQQGRVPSGEPPGRAVVETQKQPQPDHARLQAFQGWIERWAKSDAATRETMREEGAKLAKERRPEFKALIMTDPRMAVQTAVPRVIRQDLPHEIVSQLETPVAATGEYIKFLGTPAPGAPSPEQKLEFNTFETKTGKKYKAHPFGEMAPVMWKKEMPLNGVAVDDELAPAENPVRKLEVGERIQPDIIVEQICPISGETTTAPSAGEIVTEETPTVEIGERVITLCNGSHVTVLQEENRVKLQASGPGGSNSFVDSFPGTASRAIGNFRCLYMRVCYPDQLWAPNTEDGAYWDLSNTARFYLESSFGKMITTYQVTPLIVLPQTKAWYYAKDSQVDGLGRVHSDAVSEARKLGYDGNQFDCLIVRVAGGPKLDGASWGGGNRVWLSWDGMDVMNHECGHSLGLGHANSWISADGSPSGLGSSGEYGNPFDVMGGGGGFAAHYNTWSKRVLGWIPANYVHQPTANGVYRIHAFDQPRMEEGKYYQLFVQKDAGRNFMLEFHQAMGGLTNSAIVLYNGNIMDTTPGDGGGWGDAGVQIGRTFSDFESDIHFTVVAKNDTTPASLDIAYNRGPFSGNLPPAVSLAASATTVSLGGSVTFTATATDPNGDPLAYWWAFDDGVIGTNTADFTRTFASAGQINAMVTVSDMKGGTTRRHIVVNVGSHGLQTVTGNITWNGQPLQNVRVTCGGKFGYTDADGNYSLAGIATGAQTLSAWLNGYTFAPQFTNPLTVVAGTNTANWTAGNATNFVTLTKLSDTTEGGSPGAIRITRSGDTSADLVVNIAGPGGTATKNTDYTLNPDYDSDSGNYFVLSVGQTSLDVVVTAVDDAVVEGPETIALQLSSNGSYLSHSGNSIVLNVNDNDTAMPVVSVASADSAGAENPADSASFTFSRTGSTATALDLFVNWSGTAANGVDYTGLPTKVTIPAGQASATVTVNPLNDSIPETTENVAATISATPNNWVRLVRSGNTITGYRSNDGVSWTQAGTGTVSMNANVLVGLALSSENSATLATAAFDNVSVSGLTGSDIGTASLPGNTAAVGGTYSMRASGGDLNGTADSVHFASTALNGDGEIRARVTAVSTNATWIKAGVMIRETSAVGSKYAFMGIGGGVAQYDFQTRVATDGSNTAAVGPGINTANGSYVCHASAKTATASITDDDPPLFVSVSVPDPTASETGPDSGVFLITRTGSTAAPLKVYYGVSGTALHGTDYQPLSGEVTIPAGATSAPVVITPFDDDLGEAENETVTLALTTFNGAYSLGAVYSGKLTIQDNDDVPVVAVRPGGFTSESGSPVVVFRAIGSGTGSVTVNYTVSGTATAGVDYTALSGTVTIPASGTNDVTVTIPVINDTIPEPTETVVVKITPGAGYRVYNDGTATTGIYDNDSGDRVRISGWGDAPSENGGVGRIYLSRGNTAADLTVNYTLSGTATNGSDFNTLPGSVVIPAGSGGVDITITPINDTEAEGTESVTLTVVGGTGYGADVPDSLTLYISDNEPQPLTVGFASSSQSTTEQPGANGQYRDIEVTLSSASSNTVTVDYNSNGGSATGDDVDWAFVDAAAGNAVIPRGTLTFPPGTTSQNIRVSVKNDGVAEQTETAVLRLYNPRFAGLGTSQQTLSITDGVSSPYVVRFATAATSRSEAAGTEPLLLAILDRPCGATPVTVDYTAGGTATADSDYHLAPGTLTFTSGEQMKPLPLTILPDSVSESPETVIVTLSNPGNAVLGAPVAHTITLTDSDPSGSSAWINPAGGAWTTAENWTYEMVASGTDHTADFSTLDIAGVTTVTLNSARTIGNLVFADPYGGGSWILDAGSGGSLTLDVTTGTPTITVNNQSATIGLPLAGSRGLRKSGFGTLILGASNTFTGETTVASNGSSNANQPQLILGNPAGQAILGDLTIGSAGTGTTVVKTAEANQFSAAQTIRFNTNASESSNWNYFVLLGDHQTVAGLHDTAGTGGVVENMESETVHDNATLTFAGDGTYSYSGYMRNKAGGSGTGLLSIAKTGSGTQTLSGTRITYTGDTTVSGGTLALNGATGYASATTTIGSAGALELNNPNASVDNWRVNTVLAGSGAINVNNGTTGWVMTGTNPHTFSGTINVLAGTFGTSFLSSNWSGMSATVDVSSGALLDARGQAITVGALAGAGTVGTTWTSASTLTVGAGDKSGSFSGVIAGNATSGTNSPSNPNGGVLSLIKIGAGIQTLTGNNTYTGSTTVAAGTLNVTGTLKGATTVLSGATLSVGTGVVGTLNLTNSLTLAGTTTMEISKSGSTLMSDCVTGVTVLTYGGALTVTKLGTESLASGDTFTLFAATTRSGFFSSISLPPLSTGLYWDTTQLVTDGTVSVQSILANDADGDGFSDSVEVAAGTNPNSAASQPPLAYTGIRAWWKLDEASGTVADDATGLPQDGTLLNSAAWTSGLHGNAVSLNGTNQSVQIPALNLNSSYGTITAWVKRNGAQVDWAGIAFERGSEASGLSVRSNNELRYHWNLNWNYSTGLFIPDNTWTFCALVVQPGKATVYMQPVGGTMQSFVNNFAHGTAAFNGTFYIGQDSVGGRFFKGAIDDVRVYARALNAQEIGQTFEETHPPHPPVFSANPLTAPAAAEGVAYTGSTLAGSASDPDAGDTVVFSKVSGPAWLSVASDGALSGTPGTTNAGANSFTVRATDSAGLFANATLNISVAFINDAPVWNSNPTSGTNATEDAAYSSSLGNKVTDPDASAGDVFTFTKLSGPAWLNIAANGALTGTPGNSHVGANAFSVRVSDTAGTSATATLNITVANANDAPAWSSGTIAKPAATESLGYSNTLAAEASDIDAGDTLAFSKVSGPAWLTVAANGDLSGTPAAGDVGDNSFTVRVTDAGSLSANATLTITVAPFVADGVWTRVVGGSWGGNANWSGNTIANGVGRTADFSTLNLTSHTTVTLDGPRTVGNLIFGDTSPSRNWFLNAGSGGTLILDVANGAPAITVNNQTTTVGAPIDGSEGFVKLGGGTLILTGANNYTGDTVVSQGVLGLESNGTGYAIPGNISASNVNSVDIYTTQDDQFAPGAAMSMTGNSGDHVRFELLGTTQTLAGVDNTGSSGRGVIQHREMVAPPAVDGTSLLVIDGAAGTYYFDGYLRNTGGNVALTKNGANTQTLAGGNINYTGATAVNGGVLELKNTGSFNSAVTINNGGEFKLTNTVNYGLGGGVPVTIATGGALTHNGLTNGGDYQTMAGAVTVSGATTINQTSVTNTTGSNKSLFLDGGLKGSGTCTINATNPGNGVVLRNNNSTFAGQLIVNGIAGTTANLGSGLGVGGCTVGLQNTDIQVNGTMEMLNQGVGWAGSAPGDFKMGALTGTGVVTANFTGGGQMRFVLGNTNGSGNFSGVIANGTGDTLLLTKLGTGTQTLSGANTYTGTTTVSAGTLLVNGSTSTGAVTVANTATLGGTGTIGGAVTVQNGGKLAPGAGNIGTLSINNTLNLTGTTTTLMEVSNTAGVPSADRVSGVSTVTFGGTLTVTNVGPDALALGDSFTLFSATTYSGNFATVNLPLLGAGLAWDVSMLKVTGSIRVQAAGADTDTDGDGFTNGLELTLGTDPNSAASQPAAIHSGLRAWWRLDEMSGSFAEDSTGRMQDGTLLNSPVWTTGYTGGALTLNGTTQSVLAPPLNLNSGTVTLAVWIKRNGNQSANAGLIFSRGSQVSGLNLGSSNDLRYNWNGSAAASGFSSGLTIPDNQWTFCAVVVEPTKATLYMQPAGGALQFAVNTTAHATSSFSGNLYLGQDPLGGRFFKGDFDDARVYTRALTSTEIGQLYSLGGQHAPSFTSNSITGPTGMAGVAYAGTLAGTASDPDLGDTLTYSKVSGPTWLAVAANGDLSGTPGTGDAGANTFVARVADSTNLTADVTLNISVVTAAVGIYWDGTGTSWNLAANWSTASSATTPNPEAIPGSGNAVYFNIAGVNTAQTISLNGNQTVAGIVFSSTGTTTLQGGGSNRVVTLGTAGLVSNPGAGAAVIGSITGGQNVSLLLGATQSWNNNSSSLLTVQNDVNIGSATLTIGGTGNIAVKGVISGSGVLTKSGNGTLTLSGTNTYAADTVIDGGILSMASPAFSNAAAVHINNSGILNLAHASTDSVDRLYFNGTQQEAGTWGAVGSGATHETSLITGAGRLEVINGVNLYPMYAAESGLTGPAAAKEADPDGDGIPNFVELALNGDPTSASSFGRAVSRLQEIHGVPTLTYTITTRSGAVFTTQNGRQTTWAGGFVYTIEASSDLIEWGTVEAVTEVIPALTDGLPTLTAGWEYHTFRTDSTTTSAAQVYMRSKVAAP